MATRQSPGPSPGPVAAKIALRDQLTTARNRRSLTEVSEAAVAIAGQVLGAPEVRRAASVAAYVSVGREPGTGLLLDSLLAMGKRVILPLTLGSLAPTGPGLDAGGLDLDWAPYEGPGSLARARFGLLEPTTAPLGLDAIATPDVVVVPGLAVSPQGHRLGKGGGCYDKALARVPAGTFTCVLLYDNEVGLPVPVEPHDLPVTAAITPGGITRLIP